jgi:hypothetical protein
MTQSAFDALADALATAPTPRPAKPKKPRPPPDRSRDHAVYAAPRRPPARSSPSFGAPEKAPVVLDEPTIRRRREPPPSRGGPTAIALLVGVVIGMISFAITTLAGLGP